MALGVVVLNRRFDYVSKVEQCRLAYKSIVVIEVNKSLRSS